jgi:hypothetical protein
MKRKIQHNAVNNQEDEDSCTYPICFPGDVPVGKKDDGPDEESGVGGRIQSGNPTLSVHPSPGAVTISTRPLNNSARLMILVIPTPFR